MNMNLQLIRDVAEILNSAHLSEGYALHVDLRIFYVYHIFDGRAVYMGLIAYN